MPGWLTFFKAERSVDLMAENLSWGMVRVKITVLFSPVGHVVLYRI